MKVKKLNEFTIDEFNKYQELTSDLDNIDTFELLELFGYNNAYELPVDQYQSAMRYITNQQSIKNERKGVKKKYDIGGVKYSADLNLTKLKASQFIDFQLYLTQNKLEQILSVILIPMKKSFFGYKKQDYNQDYDILEVQKHLLKNFNIGDANELSGFFLQQSTNLLKVTQGYLEKKLMIKKLKNLKEKQKMN